MVSLTGIHNYQMKMRGSITGALVTWQCEGDQPFATLFQPAGLINARKKQSARIMRSYC